MKYSTGLVRAASVLVVMVTHGVDAQRPARRRGAGVACRPRELADLTKRLVGASLEAFDEANGEHLDAWSPGFPELQVDPDSSPQGPDVQCGLLFVSRGLTEVLEDQKSNLNPRDASLHKKLRDAVLMVDMLAACVRSVLGGECSPEPAPPSMPPHVFERKRWSRTLLDTARHYLNWLQHKLASRIKKVKVAKKVKKTALDEYLEGSGHHL